MYIRLLQVGDREAKYKADAGPLLKKESGNV